MAQLKNSEKTYKISECGPTASNARKIAEDYWMLRSFLIVWFLAPRWEVSESFSTVSKAREDYEWFP